MKQQPARPLPANVPRPALDVVPAARLGHRALVAWWRVFAALYVRGTWVPEAAGLLDVAAEAAADFAEMSCDPARDPATARLAAGAQQTACCLLAELNYLPIRQPAAAAHTNPERRAAEVLVWLTTD
ncbi:hypothetical protein BurJ1DRAFT_2552 [Burkholderiales bacterium JOSHI_001]|nr:hypothetical protein BurJ1DRAFT_2552 [Burkholderiales bacterium JOSHI_001]